MFFFFFSWIHLRDGSVGQGSNTFVGNCSMQMWIYVSWLTHAVNTTELISLKPWNWHSRRCDLTRKRFMNIVSEMAIAPKGYPLLFWKCLLPYVHRIHQHEILRHCFRSIESFSQKHQKCWIKFALWFKMVAVPGTWFVLWIELSCWGHQCHLRNAGTSELLLVWQGCEVTSIQTAGSWFPCDQSWSILT